jgi:hypothetical protein
VVSDKKNENRQSKQAAAAADADQHIQHSTSSWVMVTFDLQRDVLCCIREGDSSEQVQINNCVNLS